MIERILGYLTAQDILWSDSGLLWFGQRGERELGQRNFLELLSVFTSPVQIQVRYGAAEIGTVDPLSLRQEENKPVVLQLGGRGWTPDVGRLGAARRTSGADPRAGSDALGG